MNLLFALLALVSVLGGLGFLWSIGRSSRLEPLALPVAASIAATAMAGSLYYSEVVGYVPCELCWFQRIAMYSLAVILVAAAVRRDRGIAVYGWWLSVIGFGVSAYHYYVQVFPSSDSCGLEVSCAVRWVNTFGFVSIPFMAGAGFFGIAASMLYLMKARTT